MDDTLKLMTFYAEYRGIALSTLSRLLGSPSMAARLAEGRVTIATAARVRQRLSDRWPADLPWPADIPRPPANPNEEAA